MKKILYYAIPVLAVGGMIFFGIQMYFSQTEYKKARDEYAQIAETLAPEITEAGDATEETEKPYPNIQVNMEGLKAINADVNSWIYIEYLDIGYPVVQGTDNEYYLTHTLEKETNNSGCIFMDYEVAADYSDRNTFLYGHNMRDGSMFGDLDILQDNPDVCKETPYVYIYTENEVKQYEIFAYMILSPTSDSYSLFVTDEDYEAYIKNISETALYFDDTIDFTTQPDILSLSTCSGHKNRFLVQGALTYTWHME